MDCSIISTKPPRTLGQAGRQGGMSTIETLIALAISLVVLTQVCALWYYSSRSFAAQAAYTALDQDSQRALDRLSKDVRQAMDITAFAPQRVALLNSSNRPLEFRLVGRALERVEGATRTVLLNNVDSLAFSMYQRTPQTGVWDQYPTTNLANCKLLEVRWKCSR